MKQTQQIKKEMKYFSATVKLQKENAGTEKVARELIETIAEKPQWFNADGTPMPKSERTMSAMMKGRSIGDNGSRRQQEAYNEVFGKYPQPTWNGSMDIQQVLEQAVIEGGADYNEVYGTELRTPTIGDIVSIQIWEWYEPEQEVQGRESKHFLITENGFEEYSFSAGGFHE